MQIHSTHDTLTVSGLTELSATSAPDVRDRILDLLEQDQKTLVMDLSQVDFLDSSGLGALISLHKTMCLRDGQIRLLDPSSTAQQILELTRLHRLFEIVRPSQHDE